MPRMTDDTMENRQVAGSSFRFSATRIDDLGATEYTLIDAEVDGSPSTSPFVREMEAALKEVVKSCRRSPRADNLMLRAATFCHEVQEVHGFRPLAECDVAKYDGAIQPRGGTAVYDAAYQGLAACNAYGEDLFNRDYTCNAVIFVITDGEDNSSRMTPAEVLREKKAALASEHLESVLTILIGVNVQEPRMAAYLAAFAKDAGFDQYVELADATERTLAKLAKFVSHSISSQSHALGTGGPSKTIDPNSLSI